MSNYPSTPSFGGPFSYTTQQWPPPPTAAPSIPPIQHNFPPPSASSQQLGQHEFNNQASFHSNHFIPGLGTPAAPPLPPAFHFASPQLPPYPPMLINPMGYQLPQSQLGHVNAQTDRNGAHPSTPVAFPPHSGSVSSKSLEPQGALTPVSVSNDDREEGELSSGDGDVSSQSRNGSLTNKRSNKLHVSYIPKLHANYEGVTKKAENSKDPSSIGREPSNSHPQKVFGTTTATHRDAIVSREAIEKGNLESANGGFSAQPSPRREGSGSLHNPPVSNNVTSPISHPPQAANARLPVASEQPSSIGGSNSHHRYADGQTTMQLRVLAQGALLSLAPHNIRYNELIGEGISPMILKELYEEVGIKITSVIPESKTVTETNAVRRQPDIYANQDANYYVSSPGALVKTSSIATKSKRDICETVATNARTSILSQEQASGTTQALNPTSQIETDRPLERKDVIAQRLAAKAGKISNLSVAKVEIAKDSTSINVSTTKVIDTPAEAIPPREIQGKGKNKAQTELARQRMAQLKKQGLPKSQQLSQGPVAVQIVPPQVVSYSATSEAPLQTAVQPILQHPLPDRPPEPEPAPTARIPGLFMTQNEPLLPTGPSHAAQGAVTDPGSLQPRNVLRKRPRTSDFDGPTTTPKKPFTTEDRLVIDISDDEILYGDNDNSEDPDSDSQLDGAIKDISASGLMENKASEFRSMLPTTDSTLQKSVISSNPRTPASTNPQTPLRLSDHEDLKQRDLKIKAMRRRIAELEQRRKEKAKLAANCADTSGPSNKVTAGSLLENESAGQSPSKDTLDVIIESSQQNGDSKPVELASLNRMRDSSFQSYAPIDSVQLEEVKQKLKRKKEIEFGLPALDAELSKSEAKLVEYQHEEQKLLAEIAKGKEGKQKLVEELASLGTEIEGLNLDGLDAAAERLDPEENGNDTQVQLPSHIEDTSTLAAESSTHILEALDQPATMPSQAIDGEPRPSLIVSQVPLTSLEALQHATETFAEDYDSSAPARGEDQSSCLESAVDSLCGSLHPLSIEQPLRPESTFLIHTTKFRGTSPPGSVGLTGETCEAAEEDNECSILESLDEGSIGVPILSTDRDLEPIIDTSRESSVGSDVYEPPEPRPNPDGSAFDYTLSFSPAPLDQLEPEGVAASSSSYLQADGALTENPQVSNAINEPELGMLVHERQTSSLESQFSPYTSPLRYFKAYRYHPMFTEEVSGGYRSLTYSHNIDPMKYLCPFEAAGGVCNDRSCEFQHFRDLSLSDDKILVQMGSLKEGKTPEEKETYITGLKQIINDMRRDQVKDFSTVATEIAAYRRRFLKDPSHVLSL